MIKTSKSILAKDILNSTIPYCVANGKNNLTTNVECLNSANYYVGLRLYMV